MKKILALPQAISKKAIETLNGKLVVFRQPVGFNYIRFKLEYLAQQLEKIESTFIATNFQDNEEINSLKQSVQQLEKLYYRLLSTTVVSSVVLGILFMGIGINQSFLIKAQQKNNLVERSVSNR